MPIIDNYLTILTDEEVKYFVAINITKYFRSIIEEQNYRNVVRLLCIYLVTTDKVEKHVQPNSSDNCIHCYKVEILNVFDPELQLINTKSMFKKTESVVK